MEAGGERRTLPSGDVCFLFTDVESSTALAKALGDAAFAEVLERMHGHVRRVVETNGGVLVSTEGDGTFSAFGSAADATRAATAAQQELRTVLEPELLRVRMGLHVGSGVSPRDGDYLALAVHQAARVCAAANGGQVLMTDSVAGTVDAAVQVSEVGLFTVRDFDGPVRLFELPGLPSSGRHPRVPPAFGARVPQYRDAMVGREEDIAAIVAHLETSSFVTLVGPPGIGKTRLAVAVLAQVATTWAGTWFADVSEAAGEGDVGEVLVTATGCPPGTEVGAHLDAVLDGAPGVLVLDHCDQLPAAARAVAELVTGWCPSLRVIATSTSALGLPAEVVRPVAPLDLPRSGLPADVLASPAGRLFLERAQAVRELEPEHHAESISRLCARVDGNPLAIEVAAALCEQREPADVDVLLGDGSVRDVLDAVLGCLRDPDARAVAALSVVETPVVESLACAVLGGAGIDSADRSATLARMVTSALVRLSPDGHYSMLRAVRNQLGERLTGEDRRAALSALLAACTESLASGASTARAETVAATAATLLRHDSLPVPPRQQLAVQLAPWWSVRLGPARAREHLLETLGLDPTGPNAASLHLAVADTYPAGSETVDTEWHVQRAAVLLGEQDAADPAMIERLKNVIRKPR